MIYRVDYLPENKINPITGQEYDSSWIAFTLTCSVDNRAITGMGKEGVYFIRVSRFLNDDWQLSVGDFIGYCEANALNGILVMSESDYNDALRKYDGHSYNESVLRKDEALVLIHSTTADCWKSIQHDGALKSWNQLKRDSAEWESKPIGAQLGDLAEFSDYIMFGGGVSGEIVVSSKLSGFINMDVNAEYHTGARLYFDAKKMAEDGMLVRDGAHVKVKGSLPLEPYLMWVATWDKLGLNSPLSTPKIFAESADERFRVICVTVVMIVQSVLLILQRKLIVMTCADRLKIFIKRHLDLIFLLKNSIVTAVDRRTCLNCVRNVPSKSVALNEG